eukprot:2232570-Rhodomonas_salina.6
MGGAGRPDHLNRPAAAGRNPWPGAGLGVPGPVDTRARRGARAHDRPKRDRSPARDRRENGSHGPAASWHTPSWHTGVPDTPVPGPVGLLVL